MAGNCELELSLDDQQLQASMLLTCKAFVSDLFEFAMRYMGQACPLETSAAGKCCGQLNNLSAALSSWRTILTRQHMPLEAMDNCATEMAC
jgi:hypothetical protein